MWINLMGFFYNADNRKVSTIVSNNNLAEFFFLENSSNSW